MAKWTPRTVRTIDFDFALGLTVHFVRFSAHAAINNPEKNFILYTESEYQVRWLALSVLSLNNALRVRVCVCLPPVFGLESSVSCSL